MKPSCHELLIKLTCNLLKYLLLALFGFAIACLIATVFGAFHIAEFLAEVLGEWLLRFAALTFCCMATTAVVGSLRS